MCKVLHINAFCLFNCRAFHPTSSTNIYHIFKLIFQINSIIFILQYLRPRGLKWKDFKYKKKEKKQYEGRLFSLSDNKQFGSKFDKSIFKTMVILKDIQKSQFIPSTLRVLRRLKHIKINRALNSLNPFLLFQSIVLSNK